LKYFIITIDSEGDNLWEYNLGDPIKTDNARYIPRFQTLCDKFNFKPVYLVNYEMAQDNFFCNFAKDAFIKNRCEIGIHLHAWNNPPYYELQKNNKTCGLPYLIEYPKNIMLEKFTILYKLLADKFNTDIVSHRSGRWAMNQEYFDILIDHGIKIDCSVTPHVSWEMSPGYSVDSKGSNYIQNPENHYYVNHSSNPNKILEVPVTIRKLRYISLEPMKNPYSILKNIWFFIKKKSIWLRPNCNNLNVMLKLVDIIKNSNNEYLMFILHSSELMPGGSPTFKTEDSIENLYKDLNILFEKISNDFTGITLKDYSNILL
jgi:hypothetical protein